MTRDRYKKRAVNTVRKFLWEYLIEEKIVDPDEYYADGFTEHIVPIIPAQQIPEMNNLLPGKMYLIYDYETKPVPSQWWLIEESVTFSVVSQSYDQVAEVLNVALDLFRRYDESGSDINIYFENQDDFIFRFMTIDSITSPSPFDEEGTYIMGDVTISYTYSRKTDANGRF